MSKDNTLLEEMFSPVNVGTAITQVIENKGAPGIDNMSVKDAGEYVQKHIEEIRKQVEERKYRPIPVKRVWIPKDDGSKRGLGIPAAKDRIILQMITQVIEPLYEPDFSDNSFGFRPNRSCHDAIKRAIHYLNDGYIWIVDIDLQKFFDTVPQDRMISKLLQRVKSGEIVSLIRTFLRSGVMNQDTFEETELGLQQGSPLSPLLANIYLNELDEELSKRGLRSTRYADDLLVYVKSEKAANRVMESLTKFIEKKMKLKVNMTKSKVCQADDDLKYLGMTFKRKDGRWFVRPHEKSFKKLMATLRQLTSRKWSISLELRLKKIAQAIQGWCGYFRIGRLFKTRIRVIDAFLRRRIRCVMWKQWKTIRKRETKLMELGCDKKKAHSYACARQGYMRCASTFLNKYITNKVLTQLGLVDIEYVFSVARAKFLKLNWPKLTDEQIGELI